MNRRRSLLAGISLALLLVAVPSCTQEVPSLALAERSCMVSSLVREGMPRMLIVNCRLRITCGVTEQTFEMRPDTIPSPDP